MANLTPERLQELRRIAEAATPGPWAWRMNKDGRILDLITLETGHNEEILTPSHINAWLQFKDGVKDFIPTFDPPTVLALLDEIERLRREREVLAEAVMGWQRYLERDVGTEIVHIRTLEAHGRALALLGGGDRGWPTRESERARLVTEVGECCRGADPLCAAGCLVEAALRQRLVDKEGTE